MTNTMERRQAPEITAEASSWIAQLETGDLSKEDLAAFREWINRSPRHAAEIQELAALSRDLTALTALAPCLLEKGAKSAGRWRLPAFGFGGRLATAALAAGVLLVAGLFMHFQGRNIASEHLFYTTDIGEYQTVSLPDGSSLQLNTNSAVEISFDTDMREVRLAKGEAYFHVATDKARPFIVYAGAHTARAVGTAFAVRLVNDETNLIVTEGVVEFSKLTPSPPDAAAETPGDNEEDSSASGLLVHAGYETSSLVPSSSSNTMKLSKRLQEQKLSWTQGLLDFSDMPLAEVVAEANRHSDLTIELADETIADIKFGGIFRIDDMDGLLEALPRVGIKVERVGQDRIRLKSSQDQEDA